MKQCFSDSQTGKTLWRRGHVVGPGYTSRCLWVLIDESLYPSHVAREHLKVVGVLDQLAEIK